MVMENTHNRQYFNVSVGDIQNLTEEFGVGIKQRKPWNKASNMPVIHPFKYKVIFFSHCGMY